MQYKALWSDLPSEVQWLLESQAKTLELSRGDRVYRQGDQPQGVYFVRKGLVGLMITGATSGREHLLRFFTEGQFFGHRALFAKEGYHGSTIVLEPTVLRLVPQNLVHEIMTRYPQLMGRVVEVLAKELRHCETQHVMILENEILGRVAQSLIYLKDLHPQHNWTRQEIANFCASTVSTVIKALGELEKEGLIKQDGRSIQIINRQKLIEIQTEI